jgi:hypothetical protein
MLTGRYQRRAVVARPSCIVDNNSRVMRWSVRADFERAHSQIWVKVSLLVVADLRLSAGSSRTGVHSPSGHHGAAASWDSGFDRLRHDSSVE